MINGTIKDHVFSLLYPQLEEIGPVKTIGLRNVEFPSFLIAVPERSLEKIK